MIDSESRKEFTEALTYAIDHLNLLNDRFIVGTSPYAINIDNIHSLCSLRDYIIMQPLFK
jgi:hypothetical protein